ncbi:MAG: hypothetical protein NZL83_02980 [Candidatus Absconditabacterales bacterium]|nr:hypothetical protein [Candidatus Absconditabacterales bacterium]
MARLRSNARRKLRMALTRVTKVVDYHFRKELDTQRQWKTKVVNKTTK